MTKSYNYSLLKSILSAKVSGRNVLKKRIRNQTQYLHLLEDVFETDISKESFGFYPNKIYFSTPLTSDPKYTQEMKPVWHRIKKSLEKLEWVVYAPFTLTDPHSKSPDTLNSYQIRDLDHIQIMTAEVALYDLNRPSHGVGQEIQMGMFMPSIAFSQAKVSRMVKGMPGLIILNYRDEKELLTMLNDIFKRKSFKSTPFYLDKCPKHPTQSIFKGKACLNCEYMENLHEV